MVADYMALKKTPDRAYRQIAALLKESDESTLRVTWKLSKAIQGDVRASVFSFRHLDEKELYLGAAGDPPPEEYGTPPHGDYADLSVLKSEDPAYDAIEVLIRNGFISTWPSTDRRSQPDLRYVGEIYENIAAVEQHQIAKIRRLLVYLEPVLGLSQARIG